MKKLIIVGIIFFKSNAMGDRSPENPSLNDTFEATRNLQPHTLDLEIIVLPLDNCLLGALSPCFWVQKCFSWYEHNEHEDEYINQ